MKRFIFKQLAKWKEAANRKPLILTGARQVGKTWAIKHFGSAYYDNVAYIMFENNESMKQLFAGSLRPNDILPFLQAGGDYFAGAQIAAQSAAVFGDGR
jgi:predicted AAA+ superfamily ATPase